MNKIEINNKNWWIWLLALIEIWWIKYLIITYPDPLPVPKNGFAVAWLTILLINIIILLFVVIYYSIEGLPEFKITIWEKRRPEDEDNKH